MWNTAMLFFQTLLLGGYFYAHIISLIKDMRVQIVVHGLFLAGAFLTLPMGITFDPPAPDTSPLLWQMRTMCIMIGLPFFVLSASAPLLQRWFSLSNHREAPNPYFLYAASNIGSIAALLLYPTLVEFLLPLPEQTLTWKIGFGCLFALVMLCASITHAGNQKQTQQAAEEPSSPPNIKTILLWLSLAFVPSSLMLGLTSFITTDIASAPLFWIMPLTLYILSFVIAFARRQIITLPLTKTVFITLALLVGLGVNMFIGKAAVPVLLFHTLLFFATAIMCHQMLESIKPSPKHLTLYFLIMSLGGALGGAFNSLAAPLLFARPLEYTITLAAATMCWMYRSRFKYLALIGLIALAVNPALPRDKKNEDQIYISRNYYGTIYVRDRITADGENQRHLYHGTTIHGSQSGNPDFQTTPQSYYYKETVLGQLFTLVKNRTKPVNVMALGMGAGAMACNLEPEDKLTFIEIDPDIIKVATDPNLFTFTQKCPPKLTIIEGDARLRLQDSPDHRYDIVFADAFSGDGVPMHLITKEAVALYLQKSKPDGVVLMHISNRFMKLTKEIGLIAKALNIPAYFKVSEGGNIPEINQPYYPAVAVVLTHNSLYQQDLVAQGWKKIDLSESKEAPWTDSYANPLRAMIFLKELMK